MSRLSQDRETREAQMREFDSELELETRPTVRSRERSGVSIGQVAAWTIAIAVVIWLLPHVLHLVGWLLGAILQIGVLVAVAWFIFWLVGQFRKRR